MDVSDREDICAFRAQIPCFDAVLHGASSPGPSFGRMMGKKGGSEPIAAATPCDAKRPPVQSNKEKVNEPPQLDA